MVTLMILKTLSVGACFCNLFIFFIFFTKKPVPKAVHFHFAGEWRNVINKEVKPALQLLSMLIIFRVARAKTLTCRVQGTHNTRTHTC